MREGHDQDLNEIKGGRVRRLERSRVRVQLLAVTDSWSTVPRKTAITLEEN